MNLTRLRNFRDKAQDYQDGLEDRIKNHFEEKDKKYREKLKKSKKKALPLESCLKIRNAMFVIAGVSLLPAAYVCIFYFPMQFITEVGMVLVWIQVGGFLFFLFGIAVESAIIKRFESDEGCVVLNKRPYF